uniref:Postmeiotic segregation increased 2 nirs variant 3 n=1 Tax=Homo sapiens TaxID=9606 RepID=Q5FBX0_HUMAN|nr:postmeiotic segregation increased 2 nirs variant 3 [Homo sapiens]
MERAESSRSKA